MAESVEDLRKIERRRARAEGIRAGSIGGIDISLDYSWFVIFFLILGTFTGVVFPNFLPGRDESTYLLMGVVGTALFFLSLLAHELAHGFVARLEGMEVEGITLFIFGGMARTKGEAASPGVEFRVAGVGPLMSVALSVGFWWARNLLMDGGWQAAAVVSDHMALLNLALALFNLLPGFPLDGGRLLRAFVWKTTGNLQTATRIATSAGKWLGYLIVAGGIFLLVSRGEFVSGLWLIFIGWFLSNAATASYQQLLLQQVLVGVRARDAMTPFPETVTPDVPLDELVNEYFLARPYNSFPVTDDGIVVGMVTLSQVKKVDRNEWPELKVADVMTPLIETLVVSPDTPMSEVLERMTENETHRVVVAREWELRGVITGGDVTNWLERGGLKA